MCAGLLATLMTVCCRCREDRFPRTPVYGRGGADDVILSVGMGFVRYRENVPLYPDITGTLLRAVSSVTFIPPYAAAKFFARFRYIIAIN